MATWAHVNLIILQFFLVSCLYVHRLLLPHLQVERMGEKKQLERGEDNISDVRLWHIYLILSHFPIFFSEEAAWKTIVRNTSTVCPSQCQEEKLLAKIFCPFWCKVLVLLVTSACCICIGEPVLWPVVLPCLSLLMPRAVTPCTGQWDWAPGHCRGSAVAPYSHPSKPECSWA